MIVSNHITTLIKACKKLGFEYENLDPYSQQLLKVQLKSKEIIIGAGNICAFPINSATSTFIVNDKSHTINILQHHRYDTAKGDYFFLTDEFRKFRSNGKEKEDAIKYCRSVGYPLYIKPNNGSRGAFVEKIYDEKDLLSYINKYGSKLQCVRIEKPLLGSEWRLFVVDGEIKFGYKRSSPDLNFDGINTIDEHIKSKSIEQEQYGYKSISSDSSYILNYLNENGLKLKDIPSKGSKMPFSPAQNLSLGGCVSNYSESFSVELNDFTKKISKLFNLRVFGLDVYSEVNKLSPNSLSILEINGNPSMESASHHSENDIVSSIWKYILEELENES